ncbi:uracil phosphoribosyltransferase [Psychroflexus sp. YR1-1]|uniref:Uracil phosphoribosyltransferase n=1 Tax=Psychroflexus aurantiacus TaxID=2709310 RepID=A0A6B3R7R3_9FLAO|nr:uracil phosphoribosyltransferase [Psychroflexus aurantiacus]NEV93574.1 uracil phosphoribosyltransferase [Psychroflexus aurantiacus]
MTVHNLSQTNSILNRFLHQIRDETIQTDRMKFRRNIERIGEILSYEMSKTLNFESRSFQTPLSSARFNELTENIVVCSILRAGIPLHNGVLNYFDEADNAFVSAFRKKTTTSEEDFEIVVEYLASPGLEGKTLVLVDPMLATGLSMLNVLKALKKLGKPKSIHILSVIGAQPGVDLIQDYLPENAHLWIGDIDKKLNDKGYIIPGLGDAGDLAYGQKL